MVVIAIDGPSGSGKSSAALEVAARFGWGYLDTGALYRALTLAAIREGAAEPTQICERLKDWELVWNDDPREPRILLRGEDVSAEIRSPEVTERVSEIAANAQVRDYLLAVQRGIITSAPKGIVVEGRDIGTTVWPDAELKIFLTADLHARAARRGAQLNTRSTGERLAGVQRNPTEKEVSTALATRDAIDSSRETSPLRKSDDQMLIDATHLTLSEVVSLISSMIKQLELSDGNE